MKPTTRRAIMRHMTEKDRIGREGREKEGMTESARRGEMNYGRMTYDGGAYSRYYDDTEGRFRDRRGREHYDNGRYAPMNESGGWIEDRQYRIRDSTGRYTSPRREYFGYGDHRYPEMNYGEKRYVPPVYERSADGDYLRRRETEYRPMNKIGFSVGGEMERLPSEFETEYRTSSEYPRMDEVARRRGTAKTSGYGSSISYMPLTQQNAAEWMQSLENEDGSRGPHWSMEQTNRVMAQKGISCDPVDFWVTMNMMYSDYSKVAKELKVNTVDFYACMAKAFLEDKDAQPDKLSRYYECIVK